MGFPGGSAGKESTSNEGDMGSILGLRRSPREYKGYSLQYSDLENSMDYIVHGVAKSWTQLSDFHFHFHAEEEPSRNMSQTGQRTYLLGPCHGLASSTASSMVCIIQGISLCENFSLV